MAPTKGLGRISLEFALFANKNAVCKYSSEVI